MGIEFHFGGDDKDEPIISLDYDQLLSTYKEVYLQILRGGRYVDLSDFPDGFPKKYAIPPGMSVIVEDMMEAIKSDKLNIYLFTGQPGSGKSSLAYWLAFKIYGDWELALYHTVLDPLQIPKLSEASINHGVAIPLVIFDDAGLLFDTLLFQDKARYQTLMKSFQVLRTTVKNIIITTPSDVFITPKLRQQITKLVNVRPVEEYVSEARLYKVVKQQFGSKILTPRWEVRRNVSRAGTLADIYEDKKMSNVIYTPRHMDDYFYARYIELRKRYTQVLNEYVERMMSEKGKKGRKKGEDDDEDNSKKGRKKSDDLDEGGDDDESDSAEEDV